MQRISGLSASPPIAVAVTAGVPPEAPRPCGPSDRVSGLLCGTSVCDTKAGAGRNAGLLRQASVELDEPVSWHPALRADHVMVGETIPLAGLVRSGLPGVIGVEATSCRRPSAVGLTTTDAL